MAEIKRNEWYLSQVPKENALYDFLNETKERSDAIFKVLLTAFEVAQAALEFVSSLLTLIENPILTLINEIIALLDKIKKDILNAGVYFTYDKDITKALKKPHLLQGGYNTFENKLIRKLQNTQDKSRPDFSDQSKVLAITLYAGAGIGGLLRVIKLITAFLKKFQGIGDTQLLPVSGVNATYYKKFFGLKLELKASEIDRENKPEGIRVKWGLTPPKNPNPFFPSFTVPPDGFIINISSRNNPLVLNISNEVGSATNTESTDVPRNATPVLFTPNATQPINSDIVNLISYDGVKEEIETGIPSFSFVDNSGRSVPLSDLENENTTYFYDPNSVGTFFGGTEYELDIPVDKLPKSFYDISNGTAGEDISKYFVTVFATNIEDDTKEYNQSLFKINPRDYPVPILESINEGEAISAPSSRFAITAPSYIDEGYIQSLKEAISYFILARLDLINDTSDEIDPNSPLKGIADFNPFENPNTFSFDEIKEVLSMFPQNFVDVKNNKLNESLFDQNSASFQEDVLKITEETLDNILFSRGMPNKSILNSLVTNIDFLTNDLNAITPKIEDAEFYGEIQPEINNIGLLGDDSKADYADTDSIGYLSALTNKITQTNNIPISILYDEDRIEDLGDDAEKLQYALSTSIFRDSYKDHIPNVKNVLLAIPSLPKPKGDWFYFRFFDNGIPGVEEFFRKIKRFFKDLAQAFQGIIAVIQKYIALLSKRILEIQNLVLKIKQIIDAILSLRFPSDVGMLLTVSNGTDGLISDLRNSENKPDSGRDIYGTGLQLVFGGLPSILFDFLVALAGGPDLSEEREPALPSLPST